MNNTYYLIRHGESKAMLRGLIVSTLVRQAGRTRNTSAPAPPKSGALPTLPKHSTRSSSPRLCPAANPNVTLQRLHAPSRSLDIHSVERTRGCLALCAPFVGGCAPCGAAT